MTLTLAEYGIEHRPVGLTSHTRAPRKVRRPPTHIPEIGTVIAVAFDLVVFKDAKGHDKTPMTKARYDAATATWNQIDPAQAGLLMFYNTAPQPHHRAARVVSVIPTGSACYVEPE